MVSEQEMAHVREVVVALLGQGWLLTVCSGGDTPEIAQSADADAVLAEMGHTDEEGLYVGRDGSLSSFVHFVYGNDPSEVVADYGVSLSPILDPILASWEDGADD